MDYGDRGFDPRVAVWHTPDKLFKTHPEMSPYAFVRNSPIIKYDPDGKTDYTAKVTDLKNTRGQITRKVDVQVVYDVLNISSQTLNNPNEMSGQGNVSAFSKTYTDKNAKGKDITVTVSVNVMYRQINNVKEIKPGENVMLLVDGISHIPGDAHQEGKVIGRATQAGNVLAIPFGQKNNSSDIHHEEGHNFGFEFINGRDNGHSPDSRSLMFWRNTGSEIMDPSDIQRTFPQFSKLNPGTYNLGGLNKNSAGSAAQGFINSYYYQYDQNKAKAAGL